MRSIKKAVVNRFKDEKGFEKAVVDTFNNARETCFSIETEETVIGFPDVVVFDNETSGYTLIELKFVDDKRKVSFSKGQTRFFNAYKKTLKIMVLIYDRVFDVAYAFSDLDGILALALRKETTTFSINELIHNITHKAILGAEFQK